MLKDMDKLEPDEFEIVDKMIRFGGSFVKALGECFLRADYTNFKILKNAFPEYWEQYKNFGKEKSE